MRVPSVVVALLATTNASPIRKVTANRTEPVVGRHPGRAALGEAASEGDGEVGLKVLPAVHARLET
jgi:hypothetical protein